MEIYSPYSTEAPNFFQLYFIPKESWKVRWLVQQAGGFAQSPHFPIRHFLSSACAAAAVALSFFNALSYLLQIPFKIPLNIVRFDPLRLVLDPFSDLGNCLRSFIFALFGTTYIFWGILMPETTFPFFAPPAEKLPEVVIEEYARKNQVLVEENRKLLNQVEQLNEFVDDLMGKH